MGGPICHEGLGMMRHELKLRQAASNSLLAFDRWNLVFWALLVQPCRLPAEDTYFLLSSSLNLGMHHEQGSDLPANLLWQAACMLAGNGQCNTSIWQACPGLELHCHGLQSIQAAGAAQCSGANGHEHGILTTAQANIGAARVACRVFT